jgi:hypothetical protein
MSESGDVQTITCYVFRHQEFEFESSDLLLEERYEPNANAGCVLI